MPKHEAREPMLIEDFDTFYLKNGRLWVPYFAANRWRLHYMDPDTAWKGVNNAARILGSNGKVVPFALQAMRGRKH